MRVWFCIFTSLQFFVSLGFVRFCLGVNGCCVFASLLLLCAAQHIALCAPALIANYDDLPPSRCDLGAVDLQPLPLLFAAPPT